MLGRPLRAARRVSRHPSRPSSSGSARTSYTTAFPLTENPISEGGIWTRGGVEGGNWLDPKVTANGCVASGIPDRYNDDIAHLSTAYRTFADDQWAQGTVYKASGYTGNGGSHEVELHLRFKTTSGNAIGYEVMWGMNPGGSYIAVVRWNGAVGDYTPIYDPGAGSIATPNDGDVLYAEIAGTTLTVKLNGTTVSGFPLDVSAIGGTTWTSGQPGLGFWPVDGAIPENYGWKSYSAGDL